MTCSILPNCEPPCDHGGLFRARRPPSPRRRCSPSPTWRAAELTPLGSITAVLDAVADGAGRPRFRAHRERHRGHGQRHHRRLIHDVELYIQREVVMDIHLHLMAPTGRGARPDRPRVLVPPRTGANARSTWPGRCPRPSSGRPTRRRTPPVCSGASDSADGAAIAPRLAAERYGLVDPGRGRGGPPRQPDPLRARGPAPGATRPTGHDKTSIVCFQRADHPGSLHGILGQFAARNINLTKLESRPTKQGLGDYCFVIDLARPRRPTRWSPTACATSTPGWPG